jgi:hypothetical protein
MVDANVGLNEEVHSSRSPAPAQNDVPTSEQNVLPKEMGNGDGTDGVYEGPPVQAILPEKKMEVSNHYSRKRKGKTSKEAPISKKRKETKAALSKSKPLETSTGTEKRQDRP